MYGPLSKLTESAFDHRDKWLMIQNNIPVSCVPSDPLRVLKFPMLKVPKREIFDRSDFPNFYTIKPSWVGDLLVKILTYYFNF